MGAAPAVPLVFIANHAISISGSLGELRGALRRLHETAFAPALVRRRALGGLLSCLDTTDVDAERPQRPRSRPMLITIRQPRGMRQNYTALMEELSWSPVAGL
jgi:hypothetical protein